MSFNETVALGFFFGVSLLAGILFIYYLVQTIRECRARNRETDVLIAAIERAPGRFPGQSYGTRSEC